MTWRNTPHGMAWVPPQPANPVRPLTEALAEVIDALLAKQPQEPAHG